MPTTTASIAQRHTERRARRPKVAKLVRHPELCRYVQDRLSGSVKLNDGRAVGPKFNGKNKPHRGDCDRRWVQGWSPEQISNRLRTDFPEDPSMRISHEATYQALYVASVHGQSPRWWPGKVLAVVSR